MIDPSHPFLISAGEVVVDGDDMHALAFERVEIHGERRDKRLAFARAHLRNLSLVQDHAAHELDVEVAHPQRAAGRLAHRRERLRHQVVERFPVGVALPELARQSPQLGVGQRSEVILDRVDLIGYPLEPAQDLALTRAQDPIDDDWHFASRSSRNRRT